VRAEEGGGRVIEGWTAVVVRVGGVGAVGSGGGLGGWWVVVGGSWGG